MSLVSSQICKPWMSRGYASISLFKEKTRKVYQVHRLVMFAFVGKSELWVNHKNGIRNDNRLSNLEYCTAAENARHAVAVLNVYGTNRQGEGNSNAKLTEENVREIRSLRADGYSLNRLAVRFGVGTNQISDILKSVYWSHVEDNVL